MNEPNWGNTHADDCPVTKGRVELWESFTQSIANGPDSRRTDDDYDTHRDYLWGCVIEWAAGGDEDGENCDCTTHRTPEESARIRSEVAAYYAQRKDYR